VTLQCALMMYIALGYFRCVDRILNQRHPEGLAKSYEGNVAEKFKDRCAVQATNRADLGNATVGGYLVCSGRAANDAAVARHERGHCNARVHE
jgi:hypothetical protein